MCFTGVLEPQGPERFVQLRGFWGLRGQFGRVLGRLGGVLGRPGGVLGASWGLPGAPGRPQDSPKTRPEP